MSPSPLALALTGASGSGKTTLIAALIGIFTARGLTVSTLKHAHHKLAFDTPGKDSFRHAEAGAHEVILASDQGFALFSRTAAPLEALLARLAPADLVLVEGFKSYPLPRLEVFRPALGKPPLWPQIPVLAVAADAPLPSCTVPVLDLNQPTLIADFLTAALRLKRG